MCIYAKRGIRLGAPLRFLLLRVFLDVAFADAQDQLDQSEYKAQERRLTIRIHSLLTLNF